jgi:hypothetical protein
MVWLPGFPSRKSSAAPGHDPWRRYPRPGAFSFYPHGKARSDCGEHRQAAGIGASLRIATTTNWLRRRCNAHVSISHLDSRADRQQMLEKCKPSPRRRRYRLITFSWLCPRDLSRAYCVRPAASAVTAITKMANQLHEGSSAISQAGRNYWAGIDRRWTLSNGKGNYRRR